MAENGLYAKADVVHAKNAGLTFNLGILNPPIIQRKKGSPIQTQTEVHGFATDAMRNIMNICLICGMNIMPAYGFNFVSDVNLKEKIQQ